MTDDQVGNLRKDESSGGVGTLMVRNGTVVYDQGTLAKACSDPRTLQGGADAAKSVPGELLTAAVDAANYS